MMWILCDAVDIRYLPVMADPNCTSCSHTSRVSAGMEMAGYSNKLSSKLQHWACCRGFVHSFQGMDGVNRS